MTGVAPRGGPRLFLHIGRNKAGSTTLQDYFAANTELLASHGIGYGLYSHACGSVPGLPNLPSHHDIIRHCRANPGQALLISNEIISSFWPHMIDELARDLAALDTKILLYVRPYRDWIRSSYAFDVRIGINGRNIDAYQQYIAPRTSFWPCLEALARRFDWDRIRVRSTVRQDLIDGDLVADALSAIGIAPPAPTAAHAFRNAMPGWMTTEAKRLIIGKDESPGWTPASLKLAATAGVLVNEAVAACGLGDLDAVYLAPAQAEHLAEWYNRDLERLRAASGTVLTPDNASGAPPRPFVPAAAHIPQPVLRHVVNRAADADIATAHPETSAFLRSAHFAGLLRQGAEEKKKRFFFF
jgi:hypothetical protein